MKSYQRFNKQTSALGINQSCLKKLISHNFRFQARRQNEDLRIQAEERKREEQRKKMEEEDELRIRKERELDERLHRQVTQSTDH